MILKENLRENKQGGVGKMIFILATGVILYGILVAWTWQSLGTLEKGKKVIFLLIGIILTYIITWLLFQMAKEGISYEKVEMQNKVKNVLVAIFTGINGILLIPQVGRVIGQVREEQIEKKQGKKKLIIIGILFLFCIIFEVGYMKSTQEGILKIYEAMK